MPRSLSSPFVGMVRGPRSLCWNWLVVGSLLTALPSSSSLAEEIDYVRQVKPLLERCHACHGALRQQAGLRVDTAALLRKGGDSGPALVAGQGAESLIVQAVSGTGPASAMPPEGEATRLTTAEIEILRRWIDQGAAAPADEPVPGDPLQHWAFQPVQRPSLPQVRDAEWVQNPVDVFVRAAQEERGLPHAPPAPREMLLRRVYLDLIGLPPSREELQAFLDDPAPDAYERVVQKLLDSPQYGERWGRHWMDVWRYGDWAGYQNEIRESQYHLWRWRDWIIESLNADRPYDAMIVEMLAGDELAPTDELTLSATGYLARNWYKFNRNVWLDNTVEHCGKAFLGLTFNCARCHDHKYDPISHAEYYQLRAIFEAYDVRYDRLPGQPDVTKQGLARVFDKRLTDPTYLFVRGDEAQPDKEHPLSAELPAMFGQALQPVPVELPSAGYYPALHGFIVEETRDSLAQAVAAAKTKLGKAEEEVAAAHKALEQFVSSQGRPPEPPKTLLADSFDEARPELWELKGGDWQLRDGMLIQSEVSNAPPTLVARQEHPRDFRLRMTFRTLGGNVYKSVGCSFDYVDEKHSQSAYISAYDAGPKIQVCHADGGPTVYPATSAAAYPHQLGELQTLELVVRGQLANVWVNGQFKLACDLPLARRSGRVAVWVFDATAELHEIHLETLPEDVPIAAAGSSVPPAPADPAQREAALQRAIEIADLQAAAAEKSVALADAERASFEARLRAEQAKHGAIVAPAPPLSAEDVASLARAASAAERQAASLQAELAVLEASRARAALPAKDQANEATGKKIDEAETKLAEARKELEKAQQRAGETSDQYAAVGEIHPSTSTGRRLAFARWVASRDNPLTARVAVNQIWMRHFGEPLVPTVFDFGLNGQAPTHPELLDWLAAEFMENGWRMKHLHRLLVLSSTYRQHSAVMPRPDADDPSRIDPDNRWLWRMNSRRMEAETVRDSLLALGGSLDPTMGGPEISEDQGQKVPRRSVYFRHAKEKEMLFTKLFDGPGVSECYQRSETIVPQQALALANSPLAKSQARRLAQTVADQLQALPADEQSGRFVDEAFWRVLGRAPTEQERAVCLEFLSAQSALLAAPAQLTAVQVGEAAEVPAASSPDQRARENLVLVLLNHHDFVTLH